MSFTDAGEIISGTTNGTATCTIGDNRATITIPYSEDKVAYRDGSEYPEQTYNWGTTTYYSYRTLRFAQYGLYSNLFLDNRVLLKYPLDKYVVEEHIGLVDEVYYDKNKYKFKYGDREWAATIPDEDLTGYDEITILQDEPIREFYIVPEDAELLFDNYPIPEEVDITKPYYKINELEQNNNLIYASPEATQGLVFETAWGVLEYRTTENLIGAINNRDFLDVYNGIFNITLSQYERTPIVSPANIKAFARVEEDKIKYIKPQFSYEWSEWVKRNIPTNTLTHGEYIPAQRIITQNWPYGYKEDSECWYFDNSGFITIHSETGYTKNIIGIDSTNNKFKDYRVGFIPVELNYNPLWLIWSDSANDNEWFGFYHINIDEPEWVGNTQLKYKAIKGDYVEPPQLIGYTYEDKVSPYTE